MTYPKLPDIEIVQLPVERWLEYRSLRLTALAESPRSFGESLEQASAHDDSFWQKRLRDAVDGTSWLVFAEFDGELIGMAGGYRSLEDYGADGAGVWGVFVSPEHQGKGVARKLMNGLMNRFTASGVRSVYLMVNPEILAAVNLYARLGFDEIRRFQDVMGDGAPGTLVVMRRDFAIP